MVLRGSCPAPGLSSQPGWLFFYSEMQCVWGMASGDNWGPGSEALHYHVRCCVFPVGATCNTWFISQFTGSYGVPVREEGFPSAVRTGSSRSRTSYLIRSASDAQVSVSNAEARSARRTALRLGRGDPGEKAMLRDLSPPDVFPWP